MIRYLIISSLFMAFGLLGYHLILKQEKSFVISRFFLLVVLILALTVPFITIPISFLATEDLPTLGSMEVRGQALTDAFSVEEPGFPGAESSWDFSWSLFLWLVYILGILLMFSRFINGLLKIKQIQKLSKPTSNVGVWINEQLSQPFSFWNRVFLCNDGQLEDEHLLAHERVHVSQLHSLDVLLIELLMIAYWFNPLVFIYRKTISLNHEFEADQKALMDNTNIKEYLYKVVGVSQNHRPQLALASNFSFVSLKSRLHMITKKESSKVKKSFKWTFILVLAFGLFSAFTIKKPSTKGLPHSEKEFVVVIDAAHGGIDPGTNGNGHNEKDVVLSIAKLLQQEFEGSHIKVIMTRMDDTYLTLEERIAMTKNADLNVSLHVESVAGSDKELRLFIYDEQMPFSAESKHVARVMALQFEDEECGSVGHSTYKVLREAKCPSVMAIVGVFSNPEMEKRMLTKSGQKDIAKRLSNAIRIAAL